MKIENMFFEYVYVKEYSGEAKISSDAKVEFFFGGYVKEYADKLISSFSCEGSITKIIIEKGIPASIKEEAGKANVSNDEEYAIKIDEEIHLYGVNERAALYALVTLKQLIDADKLKRLLIYDYPDKNFRGYRLFIPARSEIEDFKKLIDYVVYYKYNTLIIEIGGGMEYERRPVINEKWVEFCNEVKSGPYEAERIQNKTYPWEKNSIHVANAGGSFLTKKELREIVEYCKSRYLNVIPEVPSMSHSDYLVMAYPEINERIEDKYPDTYCPSNPKTYEILFDVLEEVIEVFEPTQIHIGHDELYTAAKCEKCKGKSPVDLYVGDIIKINDFLKSKSIKASMWCEKFFNGMYQGSPCGGAATPEKDIPELYPCAGKVPKDIMLFNWYWPVLDKSFEYEVQDMGYDMVFGNYNSMQMKDYRERIDRVSGAVVSNWGPFIPEYMQRNMQYYSLVYTGYTLWSHTFDNNAEDELVEKASKEVYNSFLSKQGKEYITVVHTTDYYKESDQKFSDGKPIILEDWLLGHYIAEFSDGSKEELPVIYGNNIGNVNTKKKTQEFNRILYMSLPCEKDNKTYYETAYKVNTDSDVVKFEYISVNNDAKIETVFLGRK